MKILKTYANTFVLAEFTYCKNVLKLLISSPLTLRYSFVSPT